MWQGKEIAQCVCQFRHALQYARWGPWRSLDQVEFATAKWVHWWNHKRLHSAVGEVAPVEFEAIYYRDQQAVTAA